MEKDENVRQNGNSNNSEDKPETNSSPERIALGIVVLGLIPYLLWFLLGRFGLAFGFVVSGLVARFFLVSVPEVTGLLTINLLDGVLRPYGTGLHFRYPWEQVKEGNFINLRIVTMRYDEDFPSSDGPLMRTKWSFQYRPTLEKLPRYIAVDASTINDGFHDVGSSFLSAKVANTKAIESKEKQKELLEAPLKTHFETHEVPDSRGKSVTLEKLYGVDLLVVSIADVDYEKDFQRVRASEQIMSRLRDIAKRIRGEYPSISEKDAMNYAFIVNQNVKKDIQEVEGEGGKALAALLMAMSRGGK